MKIFIRSKIKFAFAVFVLALTVAVFIPFCSPKQKEQQTINNSYVGSTTCQSCHAKEFSDWKTSDHFKAMLPANDSSVLGNFNDQSFAANGVTNKFFKKNGKNFINTQGDDGLNHDYEVKYAFGYFPLQQYLIEFPQGRMQATRVSWDSKNKKWFHQYPNQKIPAHDWLHWTGNAQNWNTMCAVCHSTNLQKNYDVEKDAYHTTFSEVNVTCESCHGAGKLHIDYINGDYKNGNKVAGSYLKDTKLTDQKALINSCAPCHARATSITASAFLQEAQSSELLDNLLPEIPTTEHYHADGQANDEDYNYTSFAESKMFARGVQCSNCHNPHTGKLVQPGNIVCMQCHTPEHNTPAHIFHAMGTAGAECKNCHMPGKAYMGNDVRYDHTFRVPRPDLSVTYGTPNACNNCHSNKSAKWAADAVVKWYGPTRKYHFAEDLIPGSKATADAEPHLIKIMNDTASPAIVKAAAVKYLSDHNSNESVNTILNALKNTDARVRYEALISLNNYPVSVWINAAGSLLSDKVKAVRIAAAQLYTSLDANQIPADFTASFNSAKQELETYLFYQADFATGDVMLGDYFLKTKNYFNAEKFYKRALQKDTSMNYVRLNLSSAYNATSKNAEALNILLEARKIDPNNERIYYNLALLYVELNKQKEAAECFEKAIALHSTNTRLYYNYGLLLDQIGNMQKEISIYLKGLAIAPQDADLNYVLAIAYLKTGQKNKAIPCATILKAVNPSNPDYQRIFQELGL